MKIVKQILGFIVLIAFVIVAIYGFANNQIPIAIIAFIVALVLIIAISRTHTKRKF